MFHRFIILTVFLMVLLPTKPVDAAYMTSLDLIKLCSSKDENDHKLCLGYVAGVVDYHNLIRSLGTSPTVNFCVPNHLPVGDLMPDIIDYLAISPQHDQFIAAPAVAMALFKKYPCRGSIRKPKRKKK